MAQTTLSGIARQITRFLDDGVHLIGVGNTNTEFSTGVWPINTSPPPVPIGLVSLENLCGFVPVQRLTPVVEYSEGSITLADGSTWLDFQYANEDVLLTASCDSLLIQASIDHNSLPLEVDKYHSLALYVGCTVDGAISASTKFIPKDRVSGYLDTAWFFPMVAKNSNYIQNIQLIRRFSFLSREQTFLPYSVSIDKVTDSTVTLSVSTVAAKLYCIALPANQTAPTVNQVVTTPGALKGVFIKTITLEGLNTLTLYDFYTVLEDIYGNLSTLRKNTVATLRSPTLGLNIFRPENALQPGMPI